jgi:hypothetical protein
VCDVGRGSAKKPACELVAMEVRVRAARWEGG